MPNLIKDKICDMVKEALELRFSNVEITWPDHSIPFLGKVAAGSSKVELRHIEKGEVCILVRQGGAGTRWFKVKVTEVY